MSGAALKAPRGTYDLLGSAMQARTRIEALAGELLGAAGYERIETPAFEATELFARGVGSSTDIVQKEMYTFSDGSGRSLTLRPEGTAPACRAYLEHGMHKRPAPVKLWYCSNFFRYERAQSGRYRQFWQVGAEAFGSDDPALDAESVALLVALCEQLGVQGTRLRLASLGDAESRGRYRGLLQAFLREHEDLLAPEVRARIDANPLRAFDAKDPDTQRLMSGAPRLLDHLSDADAEHFAAVRAHLDAAGIGYEVDSTLVRGLDYYTRTVFELTSDRLGAQSGVGGGGRYDGLVALLGGQQTPAMGWAAGIERLALAAGEQGSEQEDAGVRAPDLFIATAARGQGDQPAVSAFALLQMLRRRGIAAQMELGTRALKRQLQHADRLGAQYVAIVDAECCVIKEMSSGEQQQLPAGSVAELAAALLARMGGAR